MKKTILAVVTILCCLPLCMYAGQKMDHTGPSGVSTRDSLENIVLEPWTYTENFEKRMLGAWASYPHWQDLAYDQNFRVNELLPGDPNLSIVQKVTPYTAVDNYAGAQKLLDMFLVPGSKLSFRFYIKTNQPAEYYKIRFAAGEYGKIDVTIPHPETNQWVWVKIGYNDIVRENLALVGADRIKIYAMAFLTKIPHADPAMPIYLGVDDISLTGARAAEFQFAQPAVYKLSEFKPYIPKAQYHKGEVFHLGGQWPFEAKKVKVQIVSFTDDRKPFYEAEMIKKSGEWRLPPLTLSFPEGLYLGKVTAYDGTRQLSTSEFTLHVAPENIGGQHPRLLYNEETKKEIIERFKDPRFKTVYDDILKNAALQRKNNPLDRLVFDLDQFPDEDWLPTWAAWGSHIYNTADALRWNAMAYAFHGDKEAGVYAKNVLVKLAQWPNWTHPWQTKRGRFSEHRTGSWSHRVAEAYDLTYNLMTEEERTLIRKAILTNIIDGVHRTYVVDDNVTAKTSNWIAMTVGGSLMNMAAIFDDGPDTKCLEPYFTGAMLKFYSFLNLVTDTTDGSWGEGLGYNNYTFSNLSYSVPSLKNVFHIDVSQPLAHTYNQYIWGGMLDKKQWFEFGDSGGDMAPATNWAFLLGLSNDPRLAWYYNYLKKDESIEDVLYDTKDIKQSDPFQEDPVKAFHKIGTTVFKSGWEKDGFTFVMRTGAFFNHQHLDQGSFWLADKGVPIIEERHLHNSDYYDDPLYQSHLIQPIAHSTILINGNEQSQRIGDDYKFAPGFEDHAFLADFLNGKDAAFSRGDIGRLYWGKIKSLTRNVLYLKPRTLIMLDEAVPGEKDVDVTLLYQTAQLGDIKAGQKQSTITKEGVKLNILHLTPDITETKAVETPHYLKTLLKERPLVKEGMLTVTAHTSGRPLIIANLLTTTDAGAEPDVKYTTGNGYVEGVASGQKFAFSTQPGSLYQVGGMKTDALCITWSAERIFVAQAMSFRRDDGFFVTSNIPFTFELAGEKILYNHGTSGKVRFGFAHTPKSVRLNGTIVKGIVYDDTHKEVEIDVPEGNGVITIQ